MWKELADGNELHSIKEASQEQPILIFKHSTRCGISSMAKNRIERYWTDGDSDKIQPVLLDLIRYREVSHAISEEFRVSHESPQILLISEGKCVYDASHMDIDYHDILERVSA